MPKIISILSVKGGVGKTITATCLAEVYASTGKKTLLVDADGQGDATQAMLPNIDFDDYDVVGDRTIVGFLKNPKGNPVENCIWPVKENLDILPSNLNLFSTIYDLASRANADMILHKYLKGLSQYDVIIIDNNPSVNKMTYNSIYASDLIIIPTNITKKTLQGVANTMRVYQTAIEASSDEIDIERKIVLTQIGRTKATRQGVEELRKTFPDMVYDTEIRYQLKPVQQAENENKSLVEDKKSNVAEDYRNLCKEIIAESEDK